MEIGIPLIVVAVALFAVGVLLRRQRPPTGAVKPVVPAVPELDVVHPRPKVTEMHVADDEARVTFDVPLPEEVDDVLSELLVSEAVEYVREKRHTLPMSQVRAVVAYAGRDRAREVGRAKLDTPGVLPPVPRAPSILNLSMIAADPLAGQFEEPVTGVPGTVVRGREERLAPIAAELRIPKAVETGLRAQGIDPETMTASELVRGTLALTGYRITDGLIPSTWIAEKGGTRTFIREDPGEGDDNPETDEEVVRAFLFEFVGSGTDQGIFVTGKFAPFSIYDIERREPRVRFIARERLQKLVDSLALG